MNTLEEAYKTWQDATLETWSHATKQVVESPTWFNAMNAQLDLYLASMKRMRQVAASSLDALDLPRKDDLVRLSTQILAAETRSADCEDRLDEAEAALHAAESRIARLERDLGELRSRKSERAEPKTVSAKTTRSRRTSK